MKKRALPKRRFRQLGMESLENRYCMDATMYTPPPSPPPPPPGGGGTPMTPSGFVSIQSVAAGEGSAGAGSWTTRMEFPVTFNAAMPYPGGFTVNYAAFDTTATSGEDYMLIGSSLSFQGNPGETHMITVLVNQDQKVELTEWFRIELSGVSKPNIGVSEYAGGTIGNDDSAKVNMDLNTTVSPDAAQLEDEFNYQAKLASWLWDIALSAQVDVPVDVYYQIMPMGIEPEDIDNLTPWTEQHVVLGTNGLSKSQQTSVIPDELVEQDESFQWRLTRVEAQGRDVTIGRQPVVSTILNNDLLKIVVDDVKQAETDAGTTDFTITVTAINKVENSDATVTFTTQDYTAGVAEGDYLFKQVTFTFTQTGPQTFSFVVKVNGDTAREANEKFMIVASNPQASFGIGLKMNEIFGWGIATITNDDEGTYTAKTGGKIAFYNSAGQTNGLGAEFKYCAEHEYPGAAFDVASEAAMNAALTAWVAAHGRVDEIAIFDHGSIRGQLIGGDEIHGPDTQVWAPLSNDGLHIRFLGCDVGRSVSNGEIPTGAALCDRVCDDAAPGAIVTASKTCTFWTLYVDGTASYTGAFLNFDGFEKKKNP